MGKGGTGTLSVDGTQVAQGRIERTIPIRISLNEGLDADWFDIPPVRKPYRPVISTHRDGPQSGVE